MLANPDILLVYLDCPMCGRRENWGKKQTEIANTYGLKFRTVSFVSPEAKGLMMKAVQHGIKDYPFFTDGKKFSKTLADFVDNKQNVDYLEKKSTKSVKKKTTKKKRTTNKKKEVKNGSGSES